MKKKDLYIILLIASVIGIFPWMGGGNEYFLSILVFMGINGLITMGLSLLMGYAGQISLGHAAFFGLGAYSSGVLAVKYSFHPLAAFGAGIFLSALIAFLVGKPTLRLKGHYMAVATLGFGEIMFIVFNELSLLTGGPSGLSGIPPLTLGGNNHRRVHLPLPGLGAGHSPSHFFSQRDQLPGGSGPEGRPWE